METIPTDQVRHPRWCVLSQCDLLVGGAHHSAVQLVAATAATEQPLLVQLEQDGQMPAVVLLSHTGSTVRLELDRARRLYAVLKTFTILAGAGAAHPNERPDAGAPS